MKQLELRVDRGQGFLPEVLVRNSQAEALVRDHQARATAIVESDGGAVLFRAHLIPGSRNYTVQHGEGPLIYRGHPDAQASPLEVGEPGADDYDC